MMVPINDSPFTTMPSDIFQNITKWLSCYDQGIIIPEVCKSWHKNCLIDNQRQFALNELYHSSMQGYLHSWQTNPNANELAFKRFKFIGNNCLIPALMNVNLRFDPQKQRWHKNVLGDLLRVGEIEFAPVKHYLKDISSLCLKVIWNPKNFEISMSKKAKKGDFRCLYLLEIRHETFIEPLTNSCLHLKLSIRASPVLDMEKRTALYWKNSEMNDMVDVIRSTLNFELENHITRLSEANLIAFSNIKTIEDISAKLFYVCDDFGRIKIDHLNSKNSKTHVFNLWITSRILISKIVNFLLWETDGSFHANFSAKQGIRWCVLSKTAEMLASKLKIAVA